MVSTHFQRAFLPWAFDREMKLKLQGFGFQATADEAGTARAKQLQEATGTVMGVGEVLHLFSTPISVVRFSSLSPLSPNSGSFLFESG
jgi:hypothetical protein